MLKSRLGLVGPLEIQGYRGFDDGERMHLTGRVLERRAIPSMRLDDSAWRNLRRAFSWLESDEVPYATVRVRYGPQDIVVQSDDEGYFMAELPSLAGATSGWSVARITLVNLPGGSASLPNESGAARAWLFAAPEKDSTQIAPFFTAHCDAEVAIVDRSAHYGIISDIDDTLVVTDVTHKLRMLRLTLLGNSLTRTPPAGTGALYRALTGQLEAPRPCFYVSKSPWNLYNMLIEYMAAQRLPKGPLLLRDLALPALPWKPSLPDHKGTAIRKVLATLPELRFVLLGDSGERDPALFLELLREHPKRIAVAYVRRARTGERSLQHTLKLVAQAHDEGLPLVFANDSLGVAQDAATRGLLTERDVEAVANEQRSMPAP